MTVTTWRTDPAHTDIQFSAKHMMVTTVRGKFAEVDGSLTLDETDPTASAGAFTVRAASLSTGNEQRDGHLRSGDFFDAETHPEITFVSTAVTPKRGNDYAVTGDLTIRGTTRPVAFDVEFLGLYQGFEGRRAGFHATTRLNREDWGLTWNVTLETGGWLVGKEIKLEIDLAMDEVLVPGAVGVAAPAPAAAEAVTA
jgi:polyisoprenoid-binding protein YceI